MLKTCIMLFVSLMVASAPFAQDDLIIVNDFETDVGQFTGWVAFSDLTQPDEPKHSGEYAGLLEVAHADGGWASSIYTFPEQFEAADVDEFHMWVYSEQPFRMRVDLEVEIPMGFRYYTPDDVGTWKEFVFWLSSEQSKLWEERLSPADQLRLWINPSAETHDGVDYPNGFEGTIFIDDISVRKRQPVEREYLPLIGFNQTSDEELITLNAGTYFEVDTNGDPPPTEGDGFLVFEFTSGWNENFTINLKDYPQILDYDRIHLDIFVDADSSNWAASSLILRSSWVDENGNDQGTGWATLSENILGSAVGDWGELSGQYGPVDSEGFQLNWLWDEIEGVFDDPNGTISLTLSSQGADGVDLAFAYVDNIRLSRPVGGVSVQNWELH